MLTVLFSSSSLQFFVFLCSSDTSVEAILVSIDGTDGCDGSELSAIGSLDKSLILRQDAHNNVLFAIFSTR